ncbi:MAG: DUF2835 family protein [Candidatus Didemnitutus sp.]|nr:DUF2835 family protein [Candidatus Didemnitutus sp.]
MPRYEFELSIPPHEFVRYYRGTTRHVLARTFEGLTVQFPANLLVKFVTMDGIDGNFVLITDDHNKVVELQRL